MTRNVKDRDLQREMSGEGRRRETHCPHRGITRETGVPLSEAAAIGSGDVKTEIVCVDFVSISVHYILCLGISCEDRQYI